MSRREEIEQLQTDLKTLLERPLTPTESLAISQGIVAPSLLLALLRKLTERIEAVRIFVGKDQ